MRELTASRTLARSVPSVTPENPVVRKDRAHTLTRVEVRIDQQHIHLVKRVFNIVHATRISLGAMGRPDIPHPGSIKM